MVKGMVCESAFAKAIAFPGLFVQLMHTYPHETLPEGLEKLAEYFNESNLSWQLTSLFFEKITRLEASLKETSTKSIEVEIHFYGSGKDSLALYMMGCVFNRDGIMDEPVHIFA